MTIRKLTVAAAIAVGIATCSFNTVMAACPCDERPVVTGNACPCDQIPELPEQPVLVKLHRNLIAAAEPFLNVNRIQFLHAHYALV